MLDNSIALKCWGGELHGQYIDWQGTIYLHSPLSTYRIGRDAKGVYHYIERKFARLFHAFLAFQMGYFPHTQESFGEFQQRVPIRFLNDIVSLQY